MDTPKRASWSGQMAFVLAAAASAIGLGNLWRFPYLAAQYGGGTFILVYLILVVTLGFTLMTTEITIGRMTQQSQLTAYSRLHGGWGFIGLLGTVIPLLIVPYYCVIGGWVVRYFVAYLKMVATGANPFLNEAGEMASGAFFDSFTSSNFAPFGYGMVFILVCAAVIALGVKNGIEKSNAVLMPLLFFFAIGISIYVCCLPGAGAGIKYYLVPNMDALSGPDGSFSLAQLGRTILGAMGQMFYSLSLAMGIMITYGSYMRKEDSIERSVRRIEIFDTLIALIAGLMIIPAVYIFAVKNPLPVTPEELQQAGGSAEIVKSYAEKNIETATFSRNELEELSKKYKTVPTAEALREKLLEDWKSQPVTIAQLKEAAGDATEGDVTVNLARGSQISLKKSMQGGTGLMFKTLPSVFADFGTVGAWVGMIFFLLVIFAALTSAISLYEACVASVCDLLGMKRRNATFFMFFVIAFLAAFSALGYGPWAKVTLFKMQFLDFFDFITNSALMPVVAAATCIFVGWVLKPKAIEEEILLGEKRFASAGLYNVMVKYFAPILITAILISEICRALGIGGWKI